MHISVYTLPAECTALFKVASRSWYMRRHVYPAKSVLIYSVAPRTPKSATESRLVTLGPVQALAGRVGADATPVVLRQNEAGPPQF